MIALEYTTLQHFWWLICAVVGSLFLFLTFVQGDKVCFGRWPKPRPKKTW
jgi:cytochrome bd ubiquinol oxidase subunit II